MSGTGQTAEAVSPSIVSRTVCLVPHLDQVTAWHTAKGDQPADMHQVIDNLHRASQLLAARGAAVQSSAEATWIQAAQADVLDATALLEQSGARPESRKSAMELILKAELALASVDSRDGDLSVQVADQLLLEARLRIQALDSSS